MARQILVDEPLHPYRLGGRRILLLECWLLVSGLGLRSCNAYYPYDGPIYAYNNLPPNQVIGNVQLALQQQGYYHGEVDGLLGPLTRAAIADYQRDHRLYVTSAIDQPTLQSLGMA